MTEEIKASRGPRQVKVGTVVSNKMKETVVVAVEKPVVHRLYHRFQKRTTKFHAHDERSEAKVGDLVKIVETRPLSRTKRWRLVEVLEAAK